MFPVIYFDLMEDPSCENVDYNKKTVHRYIGTKNICDQRLITIGSDYAD